MVRFFALVTVVLAGCFYTDPINQRPSIAIVRDTPSGSALRDHIINVHADVNDPDGDTVAVQWRAYACTADKNDCDGTPWDSGIEMKFHPTVPKFRAEADPIANPVKLVRITLEAHDDYGATAKPSQEYLIDVGNSPPTVDMRLAHKSVVSTPVNVFAAVTDIDDQRNVPATWTVFAPPTNPGATYTLTDLAVTPDADPDVQQLGKTFTPAGGGLWTIQVLATDPVGAPGMGSLMIDAQADTVACLGEWDPAASGSATQLIPISDPTLFQVLVVDDDLDPFPSVPDGFIGTTEFHWSMVPPGGSRITLDSVTGPGVAIDPASYTPGDIVELRVEIQDRLHIPVSCNPSQMTCSVTSNACNQRLTWEVQIQ